MRQNRSNSLGIVISCLNEKFVERSNFIASRVGFEIIPITICNLSEKSLIDQIDQRKPSLVLFILNKEIFDCIESGSGHRKIDGYYHHVEILNAVGVKSAIIMLHDDGQPEIIANNLPEMISDRLTELFKMELIKPKRHLPEQGECMQRKFLALSGQTKN